MTKHVITLKYEVTVTKEVDAYGKWGIDREVDNLIELGYDVQGSNIMTSSILTDVNVEGGDL